MSRGRTGRYAVDDARRILKDRLVGLRALKDDPELIARKEVDRHLPVYDRPDRPNVPAE